MCPSTSLPSLFEQALTPAPRQPVYVSPWERVQEACIAIQEAGTPQDRHRALERLRSAARPWLKQNPIRSIEQAINHLLDADSENDAEYETRKIPLQMALSDWLERGVEPKSRKPGR